MTTSNQRNVALLLRFTGIIFLISAAICSPWLLERFDKTPPLEMLTAHGLIMARGKLLCIGVVILWITEFIMPTILSVFLRRLSDKPLSAKILTSFLVLFIPLIILEIVSRPFTIPHMRKKTKTVFMRDPILGWALSPNAKGVWGDCNVTVNSKGLSGPEISYRRTNESLRILYLGDSVTFGYKLPGYSNSFPYQIEALLKDKIKRNIETINTGVGGYSPWQEYLYLKNEGMKYKPDIVMLGFVLNDVTEKLELIRFGGRSVGYQLNKSYYSFSDWLEHHSGLFAMFQRMKARIIFGADVKGGAMAQELTSVKELVEPVETLKIKNAWNITFNNINKISELCNEKKTPLVIVVFPFTFQFKSPYELNQPQQKLKVFCDRNNIPCLDLLPLLTEYMKKNNETYESIFIDEDHLSVYGGKVVASMIVKWMQTEKTIEGHIKSNSAIDGHK